MVISSTLMNSDGSLIPYIDKSKLQHVLKYFTVHDEDKTDREVTSVDYRSTCLIIDGISITDVSGL